jgi:putative transposase
MKPIVSIIMGSTSDMPVMKKAAEILDEFEIPFEINALSAHRTPEMVEEFAKSSYEKGVQYCSHQYTRELLKRNIKISMTEDNHCYENAIAERVNGILKDEFYLDQTFYNTKHSQVAVKNAVKIYNNERLHLSLD